MSGGNFLFFNWMQSLIILNVGMTFNVPAPLFISCAGNAIVFKLQGGEKS